MLHASSWAGNPARERCTREEWQGGCTGGPREALVCARGRRFCVLERGSLQHRDKGRGKVLGEFDLRGAHQTELEETKRGLLAQRLLAAGGASRASRRPYASARCPNEPGGNCGRQCRASAPSARARLSLRRARCAERCAVQAHDARFRGIELFVGTEFSRLTNRRVAC